MNFWLQRRRDNRGSAVNAVDRDGGPEFAVDVFGGWRENWFTIHVCRKDAAAKLRNLLREFTVNQDEELEPAGGSPGISRDEQKIIRVWQTRGADGIKVSYSRFVMAERRRL